MRSTFNHHNGRSAKKLSPGRGSHQDYRAFNSFIADNNLQHYQHSGTQSEALPPTRLQDTRGSLCPSQSPSADAPVYGQIVWNSNPNKRVDHILETVHPKCFDQSNATTSMAEPVYPQFIDPSTIMSPGVEATEVHTYDPRFRALPHSHPFARPHALLIDSIGSAEQPNAYVQPMSDDSVQTNPPMNVSEQLNDHIFMSSMLNRSNPSPEIAAPATLSDVQFCASSGASLSSASNDFNTSNPATSDFSSTRYSYNTEESERLGRSFLRDHSESLQGPQQADLAEHGLRGQDCSTEARIRILVRRSTPGPYSGLQDSRVSLASMCPTQDRSRLRPSSRRLSAASSSTSTTTTSDVCPGPVFCSVCTRKFTGRFGKGNLARHVRQKHKDEVATYDCEAKGCDCVFLRTDARLKHYRKAHKHLRADPAIPRGSNESRRSDNDGLSQQPETWGQTANLPSHFTDGTDDPNVEIQFANPSWVPREPAQIEQDFSYMGLG